MLKNKFILLLIGGLAFIPILACGSVGIYDPQATQVSLQGTVSALQGTIVALEATSVAQQAQATVKPTPQIIVVTATPSPTLPSTATPIPSPTPLPTSTATVAGAAQGQTIVIVATATPSPTPKIYPSAPIITEPRAGTVVEEGKEILLRWSWNGLLGPDEHFDIKIRPDGLSRSAYVAWEEGEAHDLKANLAPGRYFWTVQVVQGYYNNNSGEPEDRVFQANLGPESEPRLIIVAEKDDDEDDDDKTPTPTPTDTPDTSNADDDSSSGDDAKGADIGEAIDEADSP